VSSLDRGLALYNSFHKNAPRRVGQFDGLRIPATVKFTGEAKHVLYRSDKRDPDTGAQPKKPIDYIHEHEGGVGLYLPGKSHAVPGWLRSAPGLVKLGQCLGFAYWDVAGDEIDVEARRPYPILYSTPSGKALLVVEGGVKVVAMMWGGGLDVRPEGIVG
jgi:hypothetical protein